MKKKKQLCLYLAAETVTIPPVWVLMTNLREDDEVTDTETEAWWTWDPGFPVVPFTRHTYSPESSGVADRIRSWLPRTCTRWTNKLLTLMSELRSDSDPFLHVLHFCVITWWLEERRPLAFVQVTWGGGFPGAWQLSSRLWPSWTSAIDGWMVTTEETWSAAKNTNRWTKSSLLARDSLWSSESYDFKGNADGG